MTKKVILVGNGINLLNNPYSWSDLIKNLIHYVGVHGQISTDKKPFPLLYEEIIIEAIKNRGYVENDIGLCENVSRIREDCESISEIASSCKLLFTVSEQFAMKILNHNQAFR